MSLLSKSRVDGRKEADVIYLRLVTVECCPEAEGDGAPLAAMVVPEVAARPDTSKVDLVELRKPREL